MDSQTLVPPTAYPLRGLRAELQRGIKAAVPVMLGFLPFALVLGAQAAQKGMSVLEVPLMTGLNFGGGSEFAAVELWTSPPHVLAIVAVTLLINSRHLLMGAALAPLLRGIPKRRVLPALFLMCDESWALGMADARQRAGQFSMPYYVGVAASLYAVWVVFTAVGALVGPLLGDLHPYGFDMAFPAVFLVLLKGMWPGWRRAAPWGISLLAAALTHLAVDGAWHIAAGAGSGLLAAWLLGERA
jgi:4-azaleucine resistance transporter AzlC